MNLNVKKNTISFNIKLSIHLRDFMCYKLQINFFSDHHKKSFLLFAYERNSKSKYVCLYFIFYVSYTNCSKYKIVKIFYDVPKSCFNFSFMSDFVLTSTVSENNDFSHFIPQILEHRERKGKQ